MRVNSSLNFIEAKIKKKYDGSGVYPVVVFYDSGTESLIKPFADEGSLKQLELLKPFQKVNVEMEVYQGRNGMICSLKKVIANGG